MKVNMQPEKSSRGQTSRRSEWMLVVSALAGLPQVLGACGSDTKKPTTASPGTTTPSTTTQPGVTTNPNATASTTPPSTDTTTEPTATNVVITTDSTDHKPVKNATYAVLSYDGTRVLGYSYDFCGWIAAHSTADSANEKPPMSGEGAQFVLQLTPQAADTTTNPPTPAKSGMSPTASSTYTVSPTTTSNGITFDNNMSALWQQDQTCRLTGRSPTAGKVTWFTVSSTKVTGIINTTIGGWPEATSTTLQGGFVAEKCPSVAGTQLTYAQDSTACTSMSYD